MTTASPDRRPSARNWRPNVSFSLPAGPWTTTLAPSGTPPPTMGSKPSTPVRTRALDHLLVRREDEPGRCHILEVRDSALGGSVLRRNVPRFGSPLGPMRSVLRPPPSPHHEQTDNHGENLGPELRDVEVRLRGRRLPVEPRDVCPIHGVVR